ncbi:aldehyde dehydrogenase [Corynebacterium kalidii]|uniref:Aldehyde dehydrogenase n=1 Tax=Corynebacterium kalidii TaxID=2931982 RepID=A0A9X1WJK5_9CORY|nr:aldehyde dehydrogenase [Corynebacterium kalidii]MCJ7858757.1 aldehyde dehydrogenase [Corynebacterium kalidii]
MTVTPEKTPEKDPEKIPDLRVVDAVRLHGDWVTGAGDLYTVVDPATGAEVQTIHQISAEQARAAIDAADTAFRTSGWRDLMPHERAAGLRRIADGIDRNRERLARIQTANTGKTLTETTKLVASAAGTFRYYAAAVESRQEAVTPRRGPWDTVSVLEPLGVVAAITPWNSPIASDAQKIAPALAAGNAVVLKPAEWTPLVAMALMEIVVASGLPEGLVTVLPGKSAVIGDAITGHPAVAKISFTGGTGAGKRIAHQAADRLIPTTLELGGKSPTIVCEDADVDQALQGVLFGIFSSTGQSCIAGSRLFVHRSIYRGFVDELVRRARQLRIGPGTDPATDVGPLVHARHRDTVHGYVERARGEGGTVLCGGKAPDATELADGNYYEPTVIEGLANSSDTCQEEIFGPVLVCLPFDDEDDLVDQANDTVYGLAVGIWTPAYLRARRLARRIDAGTVWINTYKQFSISTPFSGFKDSGLGVDKGLDGLAEYSKRKSLYWGLDQAPMGWGRPTPHPSDHDTSHTEETS